MRPPTSSRLAWRVFDLLLRPWMAATLRVHVAGVSLRPPPGHPVVLCANHVSFWDGFLLREVQRRFLPWRPFHAVMLERELALRPWLRILGATGVTPGSVSDTRHMLRTLTALGRSSEGAVLAYFPQGCIRPGSPSPLGFRRGVAAVARVLAPAVVVPVGLQILPGRAARMDAFVSLGEPLAVPGREPVTADLVEAAVGEELAAIRAFVAHHGEDAADRWPPSLQRLPRSSDVSWISHDVASWTSRN